jgi:hypothetical protein
VLNDDKYYHGVNFLYLKEHQRSNGFPTGEYATKEQIASAREDIPGLYTQREEKPVSLYKSEAKKGEFDADGKQIYEDKRIVLFNINQLNKPAKFKEWAEQKLQERREESIRADYGSQYKPPELKKKEPGPEITCTSTDPEKYLGQYLAAVSMGGKFKASPEQGKEFSQKCVDAMYEKTIVAKTGKKQGELISDPFKLDKISIEANKYCKEFMTKLYREQRQEQQQEHKQEQKRSRKF